MKFATIGLILASSPLLGLALTVTSPDGRVAAETRLHEGQLQYRVLLGGQEQIAWSMLGLASSVGDFTKEVTVESESALRDQELDYALPLGKVLLVEKACRCGSVTLKAANRETTLVVNFQVTNEGMAISYRFAFAREKDITVERETTSFKLPAGSTGFLHPMAVSKSGWSRTQPSYEELYSIDQPAGTPSPLRQGWCFPALFKTPQGWVLVSETGVDSGYCGGRLAHDSTGGEYTVAFPQADDATPNDPVEPTVELGRTFVWRTIVVSDTLAGIVESTLATDVVVPAYELATPVTPGRAAWSWLALKDEFTTPEWQRKFIDLAAELKWEYVLIDSMWDKQIGREGIAELVKYAADRKVKVLLWYNSNSGQWNDAPLTPRPLMFERDVRRKEMAWLKEVGVSGLKVDFFGGDKQAVFKLYEEILRDGAEFGLSINFHGATLPRGWERRFPNLVSTEAVRGMEFCTFEQVNADAQPQHCTVLPFTRNVVGPMDFTPLMVAQRLGPNGTGPTRRTTLGFELALPVLFQSGVQHFGLIPEDLQRLPAQALDYLRAVSTTWDETKLIGGYPGKFVVMLRRKGTQKFIGAINGTNEEREITIPAKYATGMWRMLRDEGENQVVEERVNSPADRAYKFALPPRGGAVLWQRSKVINGTQ